MFDLTVSSFTRPLSLRFSAIKNDFRAVYSDFFSQNTIFFTGSKPKSAIHVVQKVVFLSTKSRFCVYQRSFEWYQKSFESVPKVVSTVPKVAAVRTKSRFPVLQTVENNRFCRDFFNRLFYSK